MAFLPQQEGTGSPSDQPCNKPVHNQSGLSSKEIASLNQIYERSLLELAEIRALAEKTHKRNEAQG